MGLDGARSQSVHDDVNGAELSSSDQLEGSEDPKRFDFGFAFNNPDFSDRIIKLRVLAEDEVKGDGGGCSGESSSSSSSCLQDSAEAMSELESEAKERAGGCNGSCADRRPGTPDSTSDSEWSTPRESSSSSLRLQPPCQQSMIALHLSSVILAAKSSYFRALFTCGLKETCSSKPIELTISLDEEGPVVDLLRFIYTGAMPESVKEPEDVIKMFLVADKFGVTSCMRICLDLLLALPLSLATACLYLALPDSMAAHKGVAALLTNSRLFLVNHFRDLERVHKRSDFLGLPLVGLQTLLASDDLNVRDELSAFSAMLEWVRYHHRDDMVMRRRAVAALAEFVRFPLMTGDDLEEVVLKAPEVVDSPACAQLVKEAAWFRSYSLVRRLRLMNETAPRHRRFWQRKWNRNSLGFVYFDIHLERFHALAVQQTLESATFGIGGKRFYLSARHGKRDDGTETLDIHLHLDAYSSQQEIQVSFIFYAKRWPEGQFESLRERVTKGFGRTASNWGYSNILGRPWAEVVQNDSKYFCHGVMSVFAEVQLLDQDLARLPCSATATD
eukprot:TRINITY_DN38416_c0_g1_i1.p1 TRINITY_DN38416_c0_g1~~TRINITY_DN38416_c0_g1_i1.p1  ORF type:complete len:558 (+),score=115.51 TRINITY_DN38416_c0_g1_i1:296-1969(+)